MAEPVIPQSNFQKQLAEWEKKSRTFGTATPQLQQQLSLMEQQLNDLAAQEAKTIKQAAALPFAIGTEVPMVFFPTPKQIRTSDEFRRVQDEIVVLNTEFKRNLFYSDLYSVIPLLVNSGAVNNTEEALAKLAIPDTLSETDITQVRKEISALFTARDIETAPPQQIVGFEEEVPEGGYPPLEAPKGSMLVAPVAIHSLTTKELLKTLYIPKQPETTMTQAGWNEYLAEQGWSEEDIDNQVKIQTEQLIAEATNRKNMLEAYYAEAPNLPEQTMFDIFKQSIINPPLVVLEGLNIYYEHVSMPAAGWLYQSIPDIKKAYTDFKKLNPEATGREAYVYAWEQWDAPGPPVLDFILKYMIMEGLVDPLTYVGWGIVSKLLKPLGPGGRALASANRFMGEVMELPFDIGKSFVKGLPKTITQEATYMSRASGSILKSYFELATRKPLSYIKPTQMYKAGEDALTHLAKHPRNDDAIAMAARELLIHPPVSKQEATDWITRLRRVGAETYDIADLTDQKLLDIDTVFERVFNHELDVNYSGRELLVHLGTQYSTEITEDVEILAARLLSDRANRFYSRALDFATERTANKAMQAYSKKALKIHMATATSAAAQEAKKAGRMAVLFHNIETSYSQTWAGQIQRAVVRTAAESYLCFGLYGPMNVIEDIWRSTMGGVKAGRINVAQYDIATQGLIGDMELRRAGFSEQFGPLRETGDPQKSNWVLTLSMLPLSLPTWAATKGRVTPTAFAKAGYKALVEFPGSIGADMRRNYVVGKYGQLLAEAGGDTYRALLDAVPKTLPDSLTDAPKWVKRNLAKDLRMAATSGKLTPDNVDLVSTLKGKYTRDQIHKAEINDIIMKYEDLSPSARSMVMDDWKDFLQSPETINSFSKDLLDVEVDDFLRGPEKAVAQYEELTNLLTSLEVTKPEDMAELIVSLHRMTATYGALPDQLMARATIKSRGLPIADRRLQFDTEFDRLYTFMDKAGVNIDKVNDFIRSKPVGSEVYQNATQRYLDITTTARKTISDAKAQDMAYRSSYFANATQKDLRSPAFWDSFYASENAHWRNTSKKMAQLNSRLVNSINDINVASGLKMPVRPAVKVVGRPLAPADVAKLIGTRGDDISKLLLDQLLPEGDKDYFVEYIMGMVREGQDVGFDRASVEAVYNQICDSILVDPNSSSWFRSRQKSIESMTTDFHELYNAKLFPDEQKKAVDKFIDEVANKIDNAISAPIDLQESLVRDAESLFKTASKKQPEDLNVVRYGALLEEARSAEGAALRETLDKLDFLEPEIRKIVGKTPTEQAPRALKPEYQDYDSIRQSSLDEANKWYYKEYPDYTNANVFDAMMKQIYPFWTYESQRWPWLARSFVRRPGTMAAWGRWENNTDYGYVHVPGTSIDVNPMRGTVYGPWSTRLMRRDYPEYYDELEGMGGLVGFFDFISRYGFYPNVIYGAIMAQIGGAQPQTGGILPAAASTPLNALIAAFPDNKLVSFISERIFPEQFRKYLTARAVDDAGGDGSLLFAKQKGPFPTALTPEEEVLWNTARGRVAAHSALFEQFGMFRMRSDESYAVYKASEAFIEEQYGYTAKQQKDARMRGVKLWDEIGGLDPWESAALRELDFFKYSGSINPVLPSKQQAITTAIERDWAAVADYSEQIQQEILDIQTDFLTGSERGRIGPDQFLSMVREQYSNRRQFIDNKVKDNPLMLLENRTEYYEKYRQAMPVQSPYNELMDLFFSIELEETVDEFGARVLDWDKFWANREMISDAIPEQDKAKWEEFMGRNTAPMMKVWGDVYETYLRKYYGIWQQTLSGYSEEEQRLINEYQYLTKTGQQLDRQRFIEETETTSGERLISKFHSDISLDRIALRYENPHLDAWLYYWGRTTSFQTPQAEEVYKQLAKRTGRTIE